MPSSKADTSKPFAHRLRGRRSLAWGATWGAALLAGEALPFGLSKLFGKRANESAVATVHASARGSSATQDLRAELRETQLGVD